MVFRKFKKFASLGESDQISHAPCRKNTAVGNGQLRFRRYLRKPREHAVNLSQPGAGDREVAAFQGADSGEKLLLAQHAGAAESGLLADFDLFLYSAYVIVVPVGRHDQSDGLSRIDTDALQVPQGSRRSVRIKAGVNEDPDAAADMQDDALAVAGTEKREFELAFARRRSRLRHRPSDRMVSSAHASPSRKSVLVMAGRSRNTM